MHTDTEGYTLTKAEAKALLAYRSTDFTRPHIYHIAFAAGRAAATDGHRMAVCRAYGSSQAPECLVDADALERAIKALPRKGDIRVEIRPGNSATILTRTEHGATVATFESALAPDLRFPPIDQIIPAKPTAHYAPLATACGFNAGYLANLALIVAAAASDGAASVKGIELYPPADSLDPLLCSAGEWLAVIMPMRLAHSTAEQKSEAKRAAAAAGLFSALCDAVAASGETETREALAPLASGKRAPLRAVRAR